MTRLLSAVLILLCSSAGAQHVVTKTYTIAPHADLQGADLSGLDLDGLDCSHCNLFQANLSNRAAFYTVQLISQ